MKPGILTVQTLNQITTTGSWPGAMYEDVARSVAREMFGVAWAPARYQAVILLIAIPTAMLSLAWWCRCMTCVICCKVHVRPVVYWSVAVLNGLIFGGMAAAWVACLLVYGKSASVEFSICLIRRIAFVSALPSCTLHSWASTDAAPVGPGLETTETAPRSSKPCRRWKS